MNANIPNLFLQKLTKFLILIICVTGLSTSCIHHIPPNKEFSDLIISEHFYADSIGNDYNYCLKKKAVKPVLEKIEDLKDELMNIGLNNVSEFSSTEEAAVYLLIKEKAAYDLQNICIEYKIHLKSNEFDFYTDKRWPNKTFEHKNTGECLLVLFKLEKQIYFKYCKEDIQN